MNILFWGATDDVTGSMTFVKMKEGHLLIDCGLTQGPKEVEGKNLLPLPVNIQDIVAVVITHAHLDHSGYLPRLVRQGFRGSIYCTPATAALMKVILTDSAKLMEESFYTSEDVLMTCRLFKTFDWNEKFPVANAFVKFISAGHILGASSVQLYLEDKKIVFSGDLGRNDDPLIPGPEICPEADLVIMESTYGNKIRSGNYEKDLHQFLMTISRESRVGLIASFAVARAQMLLTLIHEFYQRHPEEKVRVVIDSPMMKEANRVFQRFSYLTKQPKELYESLEKVDAIEYQREWESLKKKTGPLLVISSSGMLTGGRINRHLTNWGSDSKAILFLPGYQAVGTPGRAFLEGHTQGWTGEVWSSEAFSSHADQNELSTWVKGATHATEIFLLHGEETAKSALKSRLEKEVSSVISIPTRGYEYKLL